MKSYTRTVERFVKFETPAKKNLFMCIEEFITTKCTYINNRNINQLIEAYGDPNNMSAEHAGGLAAYIKRSAMESHWKHYAPRPDFGIDPNPPHPDTIPPRRHFMLNLNLPGITARSIVSAIQFFTAALKTGLLPHDLALELDASLYGASATDQALINEAVIDFFHAIAIGHQKALRMKHSYRHFKLRFHGTTLNEACAEAFTDILSNGLFPEDTELRMPPSQVEQAALICFAYPDKVDRYPKFTAVSFIKDKMADNSINRKVIYYLPLDNPEPSPPPSPPSPSKAGLFAETTEAEDKPSEEFLSIDEQLLGCKLMYDLQNCHIKIF